MVTSAGKSPVLHLSEMNKEANQNRGQLTASAVMFDDSLRLILQNLWGSIGNLLIGF